MKPLFETMRWFGPKDVVSLSDIRQSGAKGVVTALHEIENGAVWTRDAIRERKELIESSGLQWTVVESVPVHEDIKTRSGNYQYYIDHYKKTIEHLGLEGIHCICYNFMPVLDWTRTDLSYRLEDGAKALRFELKALAAFDCHILNRHSANSDYSDHILKAAEDYYKKLSEREIEKLKETILAGLPGSEEGYSLADFKAALEKYREIDKDVLAKNLSLFLEEVIPVAERFGVQLALHPDDPPFPILGLPRVASTAEDIRRILSKPDSFANGLTFCTGSFGVRKDNDLPAMIDLFANRIHFVHLRSTRRDEEGNFFEDGHLSGDVPMFEVVKKLMKLAAAREGDLPMRPDHGHLILDDLHKKTNPGYSAIGRLKGLAELRGLMFALQQAG